MPSTTNAVSPDDVSPDAPESTDPGPLSVDARGMALTVLAVGAAILLLRYMQEVLIPFVLAGLVFYALDPLVDRLQRSACPEVARRRIGHRPGCRRGRRDRVQLQDDAVSVIEELPAAAQEIRRKADRGTERAAERPSKRCRTPRANWRRPRRRRESCAARAGRRRACAD